MMIGVVHSGQAEVLLDADIALPGSHDLLYTGAGQARAGGLQAEE